MDMDSIKEVAIFVAIGVGIVFVGTSLALVLFG